MLEGPEFLSAINLEGVALMEMDFLAFDLIQVAVEVDVVRELGVRPSSNQKNFEQGHYRMMCRSISSIKQELQRQSNKRCFEKSEDLVGSFLKQKSQMNFGRIFSFQIQIQIQI
ncbi:hypothetical protein LIER_31932 [Lithospermum erythrorhizon]|uniref:Uncharacterized protein n=1 Tax=Lithospermum erythrorhizon TaxID=34254 RepID=A0AAV3RT81_LITER